MGKTLVVFLTVVTCIFVTSQASQSESTSGRDDHSSLSSNEDDGDINQGPRNVRINGYATEGNYVLFSSSHLDPKKDQFRYQSYSLACGAGSGFNEWQNIRNNSLAKRIEARPNTNVTFQIQDKTIGKIIGKSSAVTPAKEPEARVTSLQCNHRECTATVGKNCMKYNGNNVTVQFTLQPSSEKLKNPLVSPVNSDLRVMIALNGLDLLPSTKYTVTANLANNAGAATDPSLTKQVFFITKPANPSRVSSLTVTHSTPSSLHVMWSAPEDDPPKGKLSQYKLQWMETGVTASEKSVTVNESVTSFNITGLEPYTSYSIKIAAKNADTNGYGEGVYITSTTREDDALRFSWNESRRYNSSPDYYTVTLSEGEKSTVYNIIDTEIRFYHLTPGKKYRLEVNECFAAGRCDMLETFEKWTRPEKPQVIEKTELQTTTGTTITIQLPVLFNPPGMHWLLLKKYGGGGDDEEEDTGKEALAVVRREREDERKTEVKSKETQEKSSDLSVNPCQDYDRLSIAAKVEVVKGEDPMDTVVVGGQWNGAHGLEGSTEYVVLIVTETRAGPYSEYFSCEPRIMKTAYDRANLGVILGMCFAVLFLICSIAFLAVQCKELRRMQRSTSFKETKYDERLPREPTRN